VSIADLGLCTFARSVALHRSTSVKFVPQRIDSEVRDRASLGAGIAAHKPLSTWAHLAGMWFRDVVEVQCASGGALQRGTLLSPPVTWAASNMCM
jgi:hypothetical protein